MKPAWSIIVFTVLSGFGLGLAGALALGAEALGLGATAVWVLGGVSGALTAGGLCSSVLHLANPKNAWRAFMRVRSSWLSREGVLAALFFPALAWWCWTRAPAAAGMLAAIAMATVFCTAMIYAGLRPIRLWRHWSTPVNYLLLSAYGGALLLAAGTGAATGEIPRWLSGTLAGLIFLSAAGKWLHFRRADAGGSLTAGAATGLGGAKVRLLEAGHEGKNFLTREFMYMPTRDRVVGARWMFWLWGLWFPLFFVAAAWLTPENHLSLWTALWCAACGLLAERWLFFAEARHVVRLYHGEERA